ncbi:MAG: sulfurtransferase [Woeseiaceae bacterium]|nr:sulfurtransferase [Woeseiaceae bacterium]
MSEPQILIPVDELEQLIARQDTVVADVRFDLADPAAGRRSYEEGHIPGAVFLDLDEDLAAPIGSMTGRHPLPDVALIARTLGHLGIGNDRSVVVYDGGNGAIAARAWWILRWLGHEQTRLLDGGLAAWLRAGGSLEAGTATPDATEFRAKPRGELVMTTEELADDLPGIPGRRLLDARDAARYRGDVEPVDPIAGHVPGAINLPFSDLITAEGLWRSAAERRERLQEALGEDKEAAWSVMCGSGVTACHLAIAGLEAGYREPRVYVGSWSEWIRDPGRPIGVGEGCSDCLLAADMA